MSLVTISKRSSAPASSCPSRRILSFLIIDKFFLLGAAAGLFGSLVLGVYLWLMRSGQLMMDGHYLSLRELHAVMQFYLFLTPFILGFILQSATKLFEVREALPWYTRLTLPGTVASAVILLLSPSALAARILLAASIWLVAASLVRPFLASSWPLRIRFGLFIILGLSVLGGGAFLDLGVPENGLLLFWAGIVPVIFGTAQQFIGGALGGKHPSISQSLVTLGLLATTGAFLWRGAPSFYIVTAALAAATFVHFLVSTRAIVIWRRLPEPLATTFFLAHAWALIGAAALSYGYADSVLHLWGIGYAVTLIIGVSVRLVGRITDVQPIAERRLILLLMLWQVVPFARGLQTVFPLPSLMVGIGSLCAAVVLGVWAGAIGRSVFGMLRKQLRASGKTRLLHQQ